MEIRFSHLSTTVDGKPAAVTAVVEVKDLAGNVISTAAVRGKSEQCHTLLVPAMLARELAVYLDGLEITGATIGDIRRRLCMPWDSEWNSLVRTETAKRERCGERGCCLPAGHEGNHEAPADGAPGSDVSANLVQAAADFARRQNMPLA